MEVAMSKAEKWKTWWKTLETAQSAHIDGISLQNSRWAILLASAAALFIEMVMVRWHATCFHAFAIFKNVSLLSCFLGLGIGYGLSGKQRIKLAAFLPLLALQVALFSVLSMTNLGGRRVNPVAEQLVMGTSGTQW